MMSNYYLFLDESKAIGNLQHFVLGGCIIEETIYTTKTIPIINTLKNNVFGNNQVILHESDIRDAKIMPYDILKQDFEKKKLFWISMRNAFQSFEMNTIGACINCNQYKALYRESYANNEYFIALQIILENFVHFLEHKDGKGMVYIESRNPTEDKRLASHYHTIVANGTLFLNKYAFQRRLTTINFMIKQDNNVGLQIADFIPNPINREYTASCKQKKPTLFDLIYDKLYDGECGKKNKFGLKIIE